MSRDEAGRIEPPECDTHEGLLKRVRELEGTSDQQTVALKEVRDLMVTIVETFKLLR